MVVVVAIVIAIIVIAKIIDYIVLNKAYAIAKELGEDPPASALFFAFVQDFFWQKILENSDKKKNKVLKKYLYLHQTMVTLMMAGLVTLFMLQCIKYSK